MAPASSATLPLWLRAAETSAHRARGEYSSVVRGPRFRRLVGVEAGWCPPANLVPFASPDHRVHAQSTSQTAHSLSPRVSSLHRRLPAVASSANGSIAGTQERGRGELKRGTAARGRTAHHQPLGSRARWCAKSGVRGPGQPPGMRACPHAVCCRACRARTRAPRKGAQTVRCGGKWRGWCACCCWQRCAPWTASRRRLRRRCGSIRDVFVIQPLGLSQPSSTPLKDQQPYNVRRSQLQRV